MVVSYEYLINLRHILVRRRNYLLLPWSEFSHFSLLFCLFLRLTYILTDACFINGCESTQKLRDCYETLLNTRLKCL